MIYLMMYIAWILALGIIVAAIMKKYKVVTILTIIVIIICSQF